MPFPPVQDPAEAFLLEQNEVLISAPRPIWPRKPEAFQLAKDPLPTASSSLASGSIIPLTSFLPNSLKARDRRLQKNDRVEERVALGSAFQPNDSSRKSLSYAEEEADRTRRIPSPEESDEWRRLKLLAAKQKRKEEFDRAKASEEVYDLDASESEIVTQPMVKGTAVRRASGANADKLAGNGNQEDDDDDSKELCVICLQGVRDRTVLGECGHQGFCFECINVWANQSRRCPLCTAPMSQFLLHNLDSPAGPAKFYLPPLPSVRPQPLPTTFASTLAHRPSVHPFRQRGPEILTSDRDVWNQLRVEREREEEEDLLERAIDRRREIYRYGMFAKHIASNIHTRYKPVPTPRQFAENADLISRATSFLRRELRVWRNVDVEFLTTYIISLMRSIDIRSEPAVRLLADFLDQPGAQGRDRRGAEHFAHEVYSFLRSPYRDLALYDAIAQYDPFPEIPAEASLKPDSPPHTRKLDHARSPALRISISPRSSRSSCLPMRSRSPDSIYTISSSSQSRSPSRARGPSQRLRSPGFDDRGGTRPPPMSPRRWDQGDTYGAPRDTHQRRRRPALPPQEEEMRLRVRESYGQGRPMNKRPYQGREDGRSRDQSNVYLRRADRAAHASPHVEEAAERRRVKDRIASTGMRGWGEAVPADAVDTRSLELAPRHGRGFTPEQQPWGGDLSLHDLLVERGHLPASGTSNMTGTSALARGPDAPPVKQSSSMRIFGVAGKNPNQCLDEVSRDSALQGRASSLEPPDTTDPDHMSVARQMQATAIEAIARAVISRAGTEEEDRMIDDDIWGVDLEIDFTHSGIAYRGPDDMITEQDGNHDMPAPIALAHGRDTAAAGSAPFTTNNADKARLAVAQLERTRIERKEKLLAKLLRERIARDRVIDVNQEAEPVGRSSVEGAIILEQPDHRHPNSTAAAARSDHNLVDLVEMEAKARARLRLRMKLTKAKAEAVGRTVDLDSGMAVNAECPSRDSSLWVDAENGNDRASVLKARLLAKRAAK